MPLKDSFIAELRHESQNTRKMLGVVPEDKYGWKPHDKSMTMGRLASHIADLPAWVNRFADGSDFDFVTSPLPRLTYENKAQLLEVFDKTLQQALDALDKMTDEFLREKFVLKRGGHAIFDLPRSILVRNMVCSHIIHHRGQLSVYLRLLDVPVPGMYGPSADGI